MAGGGHHHDVICTDITEPVRMDPAIERWSEMRENVYKTFRMTPKASRQVFVWGFVVPAMVAGIAWAADDKLDWAGKRQGSSLMRKAPMVEAKQDEE